MAMMPPSPTNGSSTPARIGAMMPLADSASESMPLARPYCSFLSIRLMEAEKAGNWKDSKIPAKAPATARCQISRLPVK